VNDPGRPARYEIRVDGVLDDRWADWFGGLHIIRDGTQTVIAGLVPDQSALHGLLAKVRDLGLTLILVRRLGNGEAPAGCPGRQARARGRGPRPGRLAGNPPPGTTTFSNRNR
jgi:hypothetical protein